LYERFRGEAFDRGTITAYWRKALPVGEMVEEMEDIGEDRAFCGGKPSFTDPTFGFRQSRLPRGSLSFSLYNGNWIDPLSLGQRDILVKHHPSS